MRGSQELIRPIVKNSRLFAYIILAYLLWLMIFRLEVGSFWVRLGLSVAMLFAVSLNERRCFININKWSFKPWLLLIGAVVGLAFYLLLYAGFLLFRALVEDSARQVYALSIQAPSSIIALLLLFTSVGEEVYWRGLIQSEFSLRFGTLKALLSAAVLYAMAHVWTLNLPLILIALLAGLIWGTLYFKFKSLQPAILSHIVWTEMVFVFFPLLE
jgi:membrane protease YdiL (CAAX protease family)